MTTPVEDLLRATLHDLADQAHPAPFLIRLDAGSARTARRRRRALVAVATSIALIVAAGFVLRLRTDPATIIEPVVRPPKVLSVSDVESGSPGRADFSLQLAAGPGGDDRPWSTYVVPPGQSTAVRLPFTARVPSAWSEMLSADGTRYVWQNDTWLDPRLEIIDLRNGRSDEVGGFLGYCPELSPDNRTVAAFTDAEVVLVDVAPGTASALPQVTAKISRVVDVPCGGALAWSPSGDRLAARVAGGTSLVDRSGDLVLRVDGLVPTNGSMSWSPDGPSILVYDGDRSRFQTVRSDDGGVAPLRTPAGAVRPLGWAGSRIVWLAGAYGDQNLISTDRDGRGARTWMRFDVGELPVRNVHWSVDLRGTARE